MNGSRIFGYLTKNKTGLEKLSDSISNNAINQGLNKNFEIIEETKLFLSFTLAQPLNHEDILAKKKIYVLLDGNITNKQSLKEEFNLKGTTDKEIIAELYAANMAVENLLLGSYTVIIYDKVNESTSIFRDALGTKPLYLAISKSFFAFSSEIKYLKNIKNLKLTPNKDKIIQYLCQYNDDPSRTFYNEIISAKPGHIYKYQNGTLKQKEYNHYKDYFFKGDTFEDAKQELLDALTAAVKKSLENSCNEAVLLSGGLDSCVVYKTTEKIKKENVTSISKNFYDRNGNFLDCDESYYQRIIHENSPKHIEISFKNQSPYQHVDIWLSRFDQPFEFANAYLMEETYKVANSKNIDCLIDGVDGDLVISHGWERFKELFTLQSMVTFNDEMNKFLNKHDYNNYTKASLRKMFISPLLRNNPILSPLYKIKDLFFQKNNTFNNRIIKRNILEKANFIETYDFNRNYLPHSEKIKNPLIQVSFVNNNILFFKYGIEKKSPFFDKKIVDLCVSLPSEMKLKNGESRYILREAFSEIIPREIKERFTKSNLTENFLDKITERDIKNIEHEIENPHEFIKDIIDLDILESEFTNFINKKKSERGNMNIWNYYLTNKWLNNFF